jgi:plasmid stabilization system protein ParE
MLHVFYSKRADRDAIQAKGYLLYKFTQREVDKFYELLILFENVIVTFPQLYPLSQKHKNIHRAVLSKQLSVFYRESKNRITVVAILDNRMDPKKWP